MPIPTRSIKFEYGKEVTALLPMAQNTAKEIATELNLGEYNAVLMIIGGADLYDDASADAVTLQRLQQFFRRGIADSAGDANAVIFDSGTSSGISKFMGKAVDGRNVNAKLIGIMPKFLNDLQEQNHWKFILTEVDTWTCAFSILCGVVKELTCIETPEITANRFFGIKRRHQISKLETTKPVLAVLVNGSANAKIEAVQAVRHNIPLIVVKGSGGLADDVIKSLQIYNNERVLPDDPDLADIIVYGEITIHPLNEAEGMHRLINRKLSRDEMLKYAWQTFATYDLNASKQQRWFRKLQIWILCLGVVSTFFVILDQVIKAAPTTTKPIFGISDLSTFSIVSKYLLILIPIALSAIAAASKLFKHGNKWMVLRTAAESIKREIYKYRVKGYYRHFDPNALRSKEDLKRQDRPTPEEQLSFKMQEINNQVKRTDISTTGLEQYSKGIYPPHQTWGSLDDGFSLLTADEYMQLRLAESLSYYQKATRKLGEKYFHISCYILIAGAIGALLSEVGLPLWIALTTAFAGAWTSYLNFTSMESAILKFNLNRIDLESVQLWWNALTAEEQAHNKNIQLLVDNTEAILENELDGWGKQIEDVMVSLQKEQEKIVKNEKIIKSKTVEEI